MTEKNSTSVAYSVRVGCGAYRASMLKGKKDIPINVYLHRTNGTYILMMGSPGRDEVEFMDLGDVMGSRRKPRQEVMMAIKELGDTGEAVHLRRLTPDFVKRHPSYNPEEALAILRRDSPRGIRDAVLDVERIIESIPHGPEAAAMI